MNSVLLQSLQSFELIVIDDASSDKTEDLVRSYGIDGRVRLVLNASNRGLARSLNRGLELARSGLVVQLDADDWLERDCLERIQERFNANPTIGAVYGRAVVHEGDLSTTETGYSIESDIQLLTYKPVQAPRAYRTQLLRQLGGWSIQDIFDGRFFEDRLTLARVHRVAPASFINQALYHVDSATDSLSRRNPRKTALAKLLILSAEANALRQKLQATITRSGVNAQFMKRPLPPHALKWSIIIPAHGRTELLRYALRSWMESGALTGPHSAELLVIDDGSTQPLENTLCLQHPRIRFIRLSKRHGPAHARNVGASAAEQPMLFFADADRIVPPDVLSSHHLRHRDSDRPSIVVGGLFGRKVATFLEPAKIEGSVMRKLLEQLRFDRERFHRAATATQFGGSIDLVQQDDPRPLWKAIEPLTFADPYLAGWVSYVAQHAETVRKPFQFLRLGTGNVSMSAKLFKKVGGFDTAMQPMEDWEFGARCQTANIPIISAPEVESYHQLHPVDPFLHRLHKRAMDRFRRKHASLIKNVVESSEGQGIPGVHFIKNRLAGRIASPPSSHIRTGSKTRCCSLTFDDGPHPVGTLRILTLLKEFNCTATFFLIVSDAIKHAGLVRAIVQAGCALGVHGWQHRPVTSQTTGEIAAELSNCLATIHDICGVKPRFCRPPYGITSASYFRGAAEVGLEPAGWHISSRDWHSPASTDLIADLATADILNKVLLFHDGTGDADATTESVKWLVQSAKKNTVSILSLSDFAQHLPLPTLPTHASYV
jgi:peptidoglycan/xylan/chitin deacetylase (PgdA/CDA1 family)